MASSVEKVVTVRSVEFVLRVTSLWVFGKPSKHDRTEASERLRDLRSERFDSSFGNTNTDAF